MLDIMQAVNKEQLLFMCLEVVTKLEGSKACDYAYDVLVAEAVNIVGGIDDEDAITQVVSEMIVNHIVNNLIAQDLVQEDLDGNISLTEDGWAVAKKLEEMADNE